MQLSLQTFHFGQQTIELYVPDAVAVQQDFEEKLKDNPDLPTPYWSQIWAASIALCEFIEANQYYIKDKKLIELAAGLGLPSLLAAAYAKEVDCSDYVQDAVDCMQQSINYNMLSNVHCSLIDWNKLPPSLEADVLLLSDINYEPKVFETLFHVLKRFLNQGATIILATPQRIMAKPFIERLLTYCVRQEEILVRENQFATVLVLKQ